uniref:W02B3.4-like N-terminal domain-containing protein n=1 Tax=Meloidogyne enterolobii TaxID=390850 RepID=A0A6V7UD26_MELEN|nr:unnamed protein product [Meloidogyne enterolobii]
MRLNVKHAFVFSLSILTLILFFINFGYYSIKYDNTLIRIKPLIVDFDCLENQNKGKDCTYPIAVAIPDGYPQMSNEFIEIKFTLDISENSRDFWLFKNVDDSTDIIATRRFNRSQSNIENVEIPDDWKAFKRDWKNGKYLECTPLLERPKNTSRKIPIKFLDRLVEFSNLLDKHKATAFLMSGTLLGWARECSLIPHTGDTDLGIFSHEHSEFIFFIFNKIIYISDR